MVQISISGAIYFMIALLLIIASYKFKFPTSSLILQLFFLFFWTYYLSYLSEKGHVFISWLLILIPFILTTIFLTYVTKNISF